MHGDALRELFTGPVPAIPPIRHSVCLVVGTGHTVMHDLACFQQPHWYGAQPHDVIAIKSIGMFLPQVDHWVSCHPEFWRGYFEVRKHQRGTEGAPLTHALQGQDAQYRWPIHGRFGQDSGKCAAIIAVMLGYHDIVLAGLPADDRGHFYPEARRSDGTLGDYGTQYDKDAWCWLRDNVFEGRVRSMSGNTRTWLAAAA